MASGNIKRKNNIALGFVDLDRFYPDFICKLEDSRILAVEYKNSRDYDLPDNEEKRRLGALWEMRSGGKCLSVMPRGKYFEAIKAKLAM
jgi:type III restriction enzyme